MMGNQRQGQYKQNTATLTVQKMSESSLANWGYYAYGPEAKLSLAFLDSRRRSVQQVINDLFAH